MICRFFNPYAADRLGTTGPLLLQNTNLVRIHFCDNRIPSTNSIFQFEQLAHFVRERVVSSIHSKTKTQTTNALSKPERQVHAKGFGAHGYFEVTTDIGAKLSMADFLSKVGKRTSVTARFSTIAGSLGAADAVRDLRGLGFKYGHYKLHSGSYNDSLFVRFRTEQGILDWVCGNDW